MQCQLSSIGDKAWRSRIGKKLKFSLSESPLEKALEDLRKLNQDFLILAGQTTKLDNTRQVLPSSCNPPLRTDKAVQDCRLVRKASAQLHKALERACKMHEEHSAHFRLESQSVTIEQQNFPLVRFNMAFQYCSTSPPTTLEPVWIAVDSTFDEPSRGSTQKNITNPQQEAQDRLHELSNTLKRENSTPCDSSVKRIKGKTVRFDTTSSYKSCSNMMTKTTTTLITSFLADPTLPDFCAQHDFCTQLQKYQPKIPVNKYIGYFEKSGPYKHLVYFTPPITASRSGKFFSLAQIIQDMSLNSHAHQFLQHERLRLARQLSSAVLQFNATPMLKASWCSNDIVFFGTDVSSTTLVSPHLNVQVGHSHKHVLQTGAEDLTTSRHDTLIFVRNPYLFQLGVILIELARQAPLRTFRDNCELSESYENKFSDYVIADRVSKLLAPSLGPNYAKVVRKCLGCDFGEGTTDLSDSGLQAAFHRDVVCELERLEREFAKLYLDV
jgi:hypothetical protein